MQFLGAIVLGLMGLFLAVFLATGLTGAFKDLATAVNTGGVSFSQSFGSNTQTASVSDAVSNVSTATTPTQVISGKDVVATLNSLQNASHFRAIFEKAGGEQFLVAPTLYTLFVPSDAAFAALTYQQQVAINTMTKEEAQHFVMYHLVPQKLIGVTGGVLAGTVQALSRDYLNFELRDNGGTVGNAHVLQVHDVKDGIVYLLDGVLLPPEKQYNPAEERF